MKNLTVIALAGISMTFVTASLSTAQELLKAPSTGTPEQVFAPGKQAVFKPIAIDPALVRQSMKSRSEYESLNRKIIARQTKLYEENAAIKDLQAKMRDIQKKIDAILADDQDLKKLKEKFQSVSPKMPLGLKKAPPKGLGTPVMPASNKKKSGKAAP